jgi:hypothetical protein
MILPMLEEVMQCRRKLYKGASVLTISISLGLVLGFTRRNVPQIYVRETPATHPAFLVVKP